jgi:hypothetical protein
VFRDTDILAERLGVPSYRTDIIAKMNSFDALASLEEAPWDVTFHSEPLVSARALYGSVAVITEGREVTGLGLFETVLENTRKIIQITMVHPENEAEIRGQVRKVLSSAFHDVVREIPNQKGIKIILFRHWYQITDGSC